MRPAARPAAAAVALLLDELLGEPPARWHPVVGAGAYLARAGARVPASPPRRAVAAGGLAWVVGAGAAVLAGGAVGLAARRLPWPVAVLLEGVALWPLLSGRLLRREVAAVEEALASSLPEGRSQVARLVSRDTAALDEEGVRAAALGSLSENACDSLVAPLLVHAAGGLPGAALYRYANTADAMWGYRTPRWEHAGRAAARADDLLSLVPARVSALLLLLAARDLRPLAALPGEARRTPSPNGGWPMGALALLLGVRLAKPGVYALHPAGRAPGPDDTARALRLVALLTPSAWALSAAVPVLSGLVVRVARRHHPGAGSRP